VGEVRDITLPFKIHREENPLGLDGGILLK
jgi:hypothetical protein